MGIECNGALIIANTFIRATQFTGGIATIVPGFAGIRVVKRIQQVQCRLIFALFRQMISVARFIVVTQLAGFLGHAAFSLAVIDLTFGAVRRFFLTVIVTHRHTQRSVQHQQQGRNSKQRKTRTRCHNLSLSGLGSR